MGTLHYLKLLSRTLITQGQGQSSQKTALLGALYPSCVLCRNINLKPKLKEFVHCDYVDNMDYGIYALTTGYIKESAIEAGRVAIVRKAKTKQVWKIESETPFTKKPLGTRMGKGKGKVSHWAAKAIAGQVLFEFNSANDSLAFEAFRQVAAKLPVRLHLRIKPKEPRIWLNGDEFLELVERDKERRQRLNIVDSSPFPHLPVKQR